MDLSFRSTKMIFWALPNQYKDPILTKFSALQANFWRRKKQAKKGVFRDFFENVDQKIPFFRRALPLQIWKSAYVRNEEFQILHRKSPRYGRIFIVLQKNQIKWTRIKWQIINFLLMNFLFECFFFRLRPQLCLQIDAICCVILNALLC